MSSEMSQIHAVERSTAYQKIYQNVTTCLGMGRRMPLGCMIEVTSVPDFSRVQTCSETVYKVLSVCIILTLTKIYFTTAAARQ